jgi:very-short-patch-repair endonuclease
MPRVFNRKRQKEIRRRLRNDMTKAEVTLWYSLKGKQLRGYKFRRQHGIGQYVVDFYSPELKLAIEVDGGSHDSPDMRKSDEERQRSIERYGIQFLRFTDDQVLGEPDRVAERIEYAVLDIRSTRLPGARASARRPNNLK